MISLPKEYTSRKGPYKVDWLGAIFNTCSHCATFPLLPIGCVPHIIFSGILYVPENSESVKCDIDDSVIIMHVYIIFGNVAGTIELDLKQLCGLTALNIYRL